MKRGEPKADVISFKVDAALAEELARVPNRSEFIRRALSNALAEVCPLCSGSGLLDARARKHWDQFSTDHPLQKCGKCESYHLVCLSVGRD